MRAAFRFLSSVGALVFCNAVTVAAQKTQPSAEVGTLVGVTVLSRSGTSLTHIGIPGDGVQASPTLYATFFASPSLMVEPQLAFTSISSGGRTATSIGLALQVGSLFTPSQPGSGYAAANFAFQTVSTGGGGPSVNGPGFGGAVGYRFKVKNSLAIRADARYRRWFSDFKDLNEFGFGLGLGATF